jgi:peptidoglycan hydrolase-like protein with peptidoglycan-binding domain
MKSSNLLQEDIKNIMYLMTYDRSNTILEQSMGGVFTPDYMTKELEPKKTIPTIKKYKHEIMDILSIGTLFIPLIGPALSLGIDLANAKMYWDEGNKETAGLVAALSLIPGSELPFVKNWIKKYGQKSLVKALSKAKSGKPLSVTEKKVIVDLSKNGKNISKLGKRYFLKESIKKLPLSKKIGLIYTLGKTYRSLNILDKVVKIGGIVYTYYQIAEAFGWVDGEVEEKTVKHISGNQKDLDEDMDNVLESTSGLSTDDIIETLSKLKSKSDPIKSLNSSISSKQSTKNDIDKWISNITSGKWVLMMGSHGLENNPKYRGVKTVIEKVQECVGLKGKDIDGIFGSKTKTKVIEYQKKNGLKDDGVVGDKTMEKLKNCIENK